MKLQIECGECNGKCELDFDEKDYVEPDHCPFCGTKLAEWEVERVYG